MSGIKDHFLGDTPYPPPAFKGPTYLHSRDYERLSNQAKRVADIMRDGQWHTLREIAHQTDDPEASVSARIRDIRAAVKPNGGDVEHEYVRRGQWRYRLKGVST